MTSQLRLSAENFESYSAPPAFAGMTLRLHFRVDAKKLHLTRKEQGVHSMAQRADTVTRTMPVPGWMGVLTDSLAPAA